jgi:hypothetical protein
MRDFTSNQMQPYIIVARSELNSIPLFFMFPLYAHFYKGLKRDISITLFIPFILRGGVRPVPKQP